MSESDAAHEFIITVRVVPRSSESAVIGETEGVLKVKLRSPPVEGAANAELIRVLAKHFGVARSAVEIIAGQASRTKGLRISGSHRKVFESARDVL